MTDDEPNTIFATQRSRLVHDALIATLTVLEGPATGTFFEVPAHRPVTFGRGAEADLRVYAGSVSRQHAEFRVAPGGAVPRIRVRDLDSTNGVKVNGNSVESLDLHSGDKIRLGDVLLRFEWMPEAEAAFHRELAARIQAAQRDHLTGLFDRSALAERLPSMVEDLDRRGQPLAVVMLDIDHFKRINDTHGHFAGDDVLRRVTRELEAHLLPGELALRYGGEEFLALLPGTSVAEAADRAERWRESMAAADLSEVAPGLQVTASFGVAERRLGEAAEQAIERADKALYLAKGRGRNRVVLADAPLGSLDTQETLHKL